LRHAVDHDAPIFVDQEGGRVQRLRPPLARVWPSPLDQVKAAGPMAEQVMALRYQIIAAELRIFGIDGNCAPTLDVITPKTHPFLRDRCYGSDPSLVARIGRAVADGLLRGGVLPVVKHMPGHGRAVTDSHLDVPRIGATRTDLEQDFAPFRALADLPLGMTAHIMLDAIEERPATVSRKTMDLIRSDIGFGGLIMTDDISMQALTGSVADRSRSAMAAGCDVILHCNGVLQEMHDVAAAAGQLCGKGRDRAEAALAWRDAAATVDIGALNAELIALEHGRLDG
jgi:beta-N-acetylhexosaminidase